MLLIIFLIQTTPFLQYIQTETSPHRCLLPSVCKHDKIYNFWNYLGNDKTVFDVLDGIKCDVYNGYQFEFNSLYLFINKSEDTKCPIYNGNTNIYVEIKWPRDTYILDRSFNLSNMFHLFGYIFDGYSLSLVNLNGFDLNLMADDLNSKMLNQIICVGCKMTFYLNQKRINSCEDILGSNANAEIDSIFQICQTLVSSNIVLKSYIKVFLLNNLFISPICPLVFNNSMMSSLSLNYLINTFYKQNILTFSKLNSSKYVVKSEIDDISLIQIQEIDLDSRFLSPLVFQKLKSISILGTVRNIEKEVFKSFDNLEVLSFQSSDFRKIIHNSGIGWIKSINEDININMTNITHVYINKNKIKKIHLECIYLIEHVSIEDVFPEEDFCLYHDFPFDQLIFLVKVCDTKSDEEHKKFTCTFLWLTQYYKLYHMIFPNEIWPIIYKINYYYFILQVLTNPNYNSSLSNCFFPKMLDLCNKSSYHINSFWHTSDYMDFNEILKMVIKILSFIVSLFGIITNLLVIITILHKKNKELFKEFNQYSYLWLNSLFSLLILLIQMLSWMSECFYPYGVFCPEIRKSIFVQIFKMVFKECLITSFRLMCNFTYVAFSFNRISLIGKDHGKFVKFFTTIDKRAYIGVCFLISCGISVIKYFKYEINFDGYEANFPISNEINLSSIYWTHASNFAFFILNSIFDFLNYILFEIITSIIDIYMTFQLRRVLGEKFKKSESLIKDTKKLENIKKEHDGALEKANKMVILNTTISIIFRMPIAFIPIINVYAEFYYKDFETYYNHPRFDLFYTFLLDSGFYQIIIELSDLLYTISLSILLFIYLRFDKKFHEGFKCVFSKG